MCVCPDACPFCLSLLSFDFAPTPSPGIALPWGLLLAAPLGGCLFTSAISKPRDRQRKPRRCPFSNLLTGPLVVIFGIGAPGSRARTRRGSSLPPLPGERSEPQDPGLRWVRTNGEGTPVNPFYLYSPAGLCLPCHPTSLNVVWATLATCALDKATAPLPTPGPSHRARPLPCLQQALAHQFRDKNRTSLCHQAPQDQRQPSPLASFPSTPSSCPRGPRGPRQLGVLPPGLLFAFLFAHLTH